MQLSNGSRRFIDKLRRTQVGEAVEATGLWGRMIADCFKTLFTKPPTLSSVIWEIHQVGVKSFVIVAVAAVATGLVMSLQFGFGLARFGAKLYVPKIVSLSIVRELGAMFTALMLSGRVGAGIASEIGSMKVTEQIDAMRALGTSPIRKLILPKIIACTLAAPLLTMLADMLGIFGGMAISKTLGLSGYDYFFKSFDIITGRDVAGGLVKALVFGFIISSVGCFVGMRTEGGTQGVGNSTTKAVVISSVLIMFSDFVMTQALWILETKLRSGGG